MLNGNILEKLISRSINSFISIGDDDAEYIKEEDIQPMKDYLFDKIIKEINSKYE